MNEGAAVPTNEVTEPMTVDNEPAAAPAAAAAVPARRGPTREGFSSVATVVAFGAVFVVYAIWLRGDFYDVTRLSFDASRSAPQLVLAVAVAVCLSGRQFDFSVAAVATGGCFMTCGLFLDRGWSMVLAIVATLVCGALVGLVNGGLVTRFRVSAFIATLGTSGLVSGLAVAYSGGLVVGPTPDSGPLPSWFSGAGSIGDFQNKVPLVVGLVVVAAVVLAGLVSLDQRFPGPDRLRPARTVGLFVAAGLLVLGAWALGIPDEMDWMIVIIVGLAVVVWIGMKYTSVGQSVYAVGGSPSAASFAGIRTNRIWLCLFLFSGAIAAVAGVLIASQQGSASPGVADSLLLPAYAGAFLSTVIISRGRFHIWGTVAGSLALVYVTDGLVVGGVPYTWTQVINGAVLIVTVALSTILQRRPTR
jgi:ribose/xylose/arabinose/galactoside ABC-type transport system permease subunit